jgi:hypothetical protein
VPICLPIQKLASAPAPRFKSALLARNSNGMSDLRDLYSKIATEWAASSEQGKKLYAATEPKLRELILGMDESRDSQYASVDFEVGVMHAASGNYDRANVYFSHALAKLHKKLAYGYDVSGEVGEKGGTNGQDRHLWDTSNSPKNNHTQNNPGAMVLDAEAESDYPELAAFKHKRVHWPPRTR